MKKLFNCFLLFLMTLSYLSFPVAAEEKKYDNIAKHAIAIEVRTGKILYEKDAHKVTGIASTTKLITAYLVLEAIKDGDLKLDDKVKLSDYPWELAINALSSNVPMNKREYTVTQLLDAMIISSSNSAAIALAERLAGTEPKFVDLMRKKVESWGIKDAKLYTASGLDNQVLGEHRYPNSDPEAENMMSAYDLAIVAKHILEDHPEIIDYTSKNTADFDGTTLITTNIMLEGMTRNRAGVDGLKTGSSGNFGDSFVASSHEHGMHLVTVVLGVDNTEDIDARFVATASLMNWVNQNYYTNILAKEEDTYDNKKSPVINGKKDSVKALAKEDIYVIQRRENMNEPKVTINYKTPGYEAPIKKGQDVGSLTFKEDDPQGVKYIDNKMPTFTLEAGEPVERSFFLRVWWNEFVRYVNEKL